MKSHKIQRGVHRDLFYCTTQRLKRIALINKARPQLAHKKSFKSLEFKSCKK